VNVLKARKINIKSYTIQVIGPEGPQERQYDVPQSIENVILAPTLRLSMPDCLRNARIAEKVKAETKKGFVLLEEADYQIILAGFKAFTGFGKNEVELCKRIQDAETVEVKETKSKSK